MVINDWHHKLKALIQQFFLSTYTVCHIKFVNIPQTLYNIESIEPLPWESEIQVQIYSGYNSSVGYYQDGVALVQSSEKMEE